MLLLSAGVSEGDSLSNPVLDFHPPYYFLTQQIYTIETTRKNEVNQCEAYYKLFS